MKKIFISFVALAAIAACSKTEVQYENSAEIGFAPVKGNVTKAEGFEGILPSTQELGVWAFWDKDGEVDQDITNENVSNYDDNYLVNALFANKQGTTSWGGSPVGYPWPISGSLIFAGYTTPGDTPLTIDTQVSYDKASDVMTFTNYTNTEFDLCWFGRTGKSYNYRASETATAVTATLSHALTWVTVSVYGDGTPVNNWVITSMTLDDVNVSGTAECNGSTKKATWDDCTSNQVTIFSGNHTIQSAIEGKGTVLTNNVLIPTEDVQLTFNYTFSVNGESKTDSKTVRLNTETWESGMHYTYTLVVKANEILVAPTYGEWGTSDNTVTVE